MENYFVTKQKRTEVKDDQGKVLGVQQVNEANLQGRVLKVLGEPVKDEHGREYFGCVTEINPGYDRFFQTADPAIAAQLLKLNKGDLVKVTGVLKRNGSGRGFHVRATAINVLEQAPTQETAEPTPAA